MAHTPCLSRPVATVALLLPLFAYSSQAFLWLGGGSSSKETAYVKSIQAARDLLKGGKQKEGSLPDAEAFFRLARARQEFFCRDSFNLQGNLGADSIPLGPNTILKKMRPDPLYLALYTSGDIVSSWEIDGRGWEVGERNHIKWALDYALPPGAKTTSTVGKALFVDIGANIGVFSLNMAADGYEVISFEGAKRDSCYIVADRTNWGNGNSVCGADNETHAMQISGFPGQLVRDRMNVERLDTVLDRDIKAIKMDVEGFEPFVIQGAIGLFEQHRVWFMVMEINKPGLRARLAGTNTTINAHIMNLNRLGYKVSFQSFQGPFMSTQELDKFTSEYNHCEICNLYFVSPNITVPALPQQVQIAQGRRTLQTLAR